MDRWLFVHVMKTAGTSFRSMLEQGFDAEIYPTQAELHRHPRHFYLSAPELLETVASGAIDLSDRRTAPWPADVAANLDRRIAEHAALPFPAVTSGSLGLR